MSSYITSHPHSFQAKEIVTSGVLGRITSTTVLGIDSELLNLPEKNRYINDPTSGTLKQP